MAGSLETGGMRTLRAASIGVKRAQFAAATAHSFLITGLVPAINAFLVSRQHRRG
jgi:hypothetical protein